MTKTENHIIVFSRVRQKSHEGVHHRGCSSLCGFFCWCMIDFVQQNDLQSVYCFVCLSTEFLLYVIVKRAKAAVSMERGR